MKIHIDYQTFLNDIELLAAKINSSTIKYDAMIAITGGGLFPARVLRNYLNIPIYTVNVKFYDEFDKKTSEPKILQWLGENEKKQLQNKNILIVDDLDDTRGTILQVLLLMLQDENLKINNIGISVLYNKLKDKVNTIPSFCEYIFVKEIEDNWVVFPWEFKKNIEMNNYCSNKIL